MVWWQIVLILFGAVVVGILGGFLLYRLIQKFSYFIKPGFRINRSARWRLSSGPPPASAAKLKRYQITHLGEERTEKPTLTAVGGRSNKNNNQKSSFVPLFSRLSLIVLSVGLIVGILLSLTYWALSPINVRFQPEWPPILVAGVNEDKPVVYQSTMKIEVEGFWSKADEREKLEDFGEYCALVINSGIFSEYLSQAHQELDLDYAHTVRTAEELSGMITASYRYEEHIVRVRVNSNDPDEATAIGGLVSEVFPDYLLAELNAMRMEQYHLLLERLDVVSVSLSEVKKSMDALLPDDGDNLQEDAAYLALEAKTAALNAELNALAAQEIAMTDRNTYEHEEILEEIMEVSRALAEARREMEAFIQHSDIEEIKLTPEYITLYTKETALEQERYRLITDLAWANSYYLDKLELVDSVIPGSPSDPETLPPDRVRGRNAIMMGAVLGIGCAWLGLNSRGLINEIRRFTYTNGRPAEEEEEDEEQE